MAVFPYVFTVAMAIISYIVYQKYVTVYTSLIVRPDKRYDYIIVGAGTSGCVLASRLSEDPHTRVLVVEAGDQMGYFTRVPLTATAAQRGHNDWAFKTHPQKYSSFGMWGQSQFIPRGKGLGGSGQINFLVHGFGLPEDYERWTKLGFQGWSYKELKPYFVKAFGTIKNEFDSEDCSIDGVCPGDRAPMKLKLISEKDELMNTFRLASSLIKDNLTEFRKPAATVKDGTRFATLEAYLKPALNRKNLHVLLKTEAISIRFENNKASSLYILQNHRDLNNIFANKEIILSAGAIKTPQILLRSGIGPREELSRLHIKPVSFNEGVGRNLHDHMSMPIYVSVNKPITLTLGKVFTLRTLWQYLWKGKGLLSFPPIAGIEYHNGSSVVLFSMGTASERLLRDLSNYKHQVFRDTFPFYNVSNKEGFMLICGCVQPTSRGSVTLSDVSTVTPPTLDPRYLATAHDVNCIVQAIRRAERLISTKPFQDIGARIHWPRPERCLSFWNYTRHEQRGVRRRKSRKGSSVVKYALKSPPSEYLSCIIREVAVTGHHVGGTCAGGTVVDSELRVKSISGLRIMDASVLPSPTSLFPNSVLIAMAEKAADIIRHII